MTAEGERRLSFASVGGGCTQLAARPEQLQRVCRSPGRAIGRLWSESAGAAAFSPTCSSLSSLAAGSRRPPLAQLLRATLTRPAARSEHCQAACGQQHAAGQVPRPGNAWPATTTTSRSGSLSSAAHRQPCLLWTCPGSAESCCRPAAAHLAQMRRAEGSQGLQHGGDLLVQWLS